MISGEEDLKELAVFTDRGGLTEFNLFFANEYEKNINEINLSKAA